MLPHVSFVNHWLRGDWDIQPDNDKHRTRPLWETLISVISCVGEDGEGERRGAQDNPNTQTLKSQTNPMENGIGFAV